ncbi:MAG: hypothetical protein ACTSW1_13970, partial [Candidatus Hodarchaeales archaeon]
HSRRNRYKAVQREILEIIDKKVIERKEDFLSFLPSGISENFTNKEVIDKMQMPEVSHRTKVNIVGKMTYSLWKMGVLKRVGKKVNSYVYELDTSNNP